MARRRRRNNHGNRINLNKRKENNRRISNPQTPEEERQAIQQDLDSEVMGMVRQIYLEKALERKNIRTAMGVGGSEDNLNFFEKSFEEGYADVTNEDENYPYGFKDEETPDIKRVSNLTTATSSNSEDTTGETQPDSSQTNRR